MNGESRFCRGRQSSMTRAKAEEVRAKSGMSAQGKGPLPAVLFEISDAGQLLSASSLPAGGSLIYAAEWGDSLTRVAARFGMDIPAELNGLKPTARLQLGQQLQIDILYRVPSPLRTASLSISPSDCSSILRLENWRQPIPQVWARKPGAPRTLEIPCNGAVCQTISTNGCAR
jgi:LysM domain